MCFVEDAKMLPRFPFKKGLAGQLLECGQQTALSCQSLHGLSQLQRAMLHEITAFLGGLHALERAGHFSLTQDTLMGDTHSRGTSQVG